LGPVNKYPLDPINQYPLDPINQYPLDPINQYPLDPINQYPLDPINQYPLDHINQYPLDHLPGHCGYVSGPLWSSYAEENHEIYTYPARVALELFDAAADSSSGDMSSDGTR
jgi:hypothetical protein